MFVILAELPAQDRLFIQNHKEVHSCGNGQDGGDYERVGVPEHNPQSDPAYRKTRYMGLRTQR
jgi:hypothetical protein